MPRSSCRRGWRWGTRPPGSAAIPPSPSGVRLHIWQLQLGALPWGTQVAAAAECYCTWPLLSTPALACKLFMQSSLMYAHRTHLLPQATKTWRNKALCGLAPQPSQAPNHCRPWSSLPHRRQQRERGLVRLVPPDPRQPAAVRRRLLPPVRGRGSPGQFQAPNLEPLFSPV